MYTENQIFLSPANTSGFVRTEPRDVKINSHAELSENEAVKNVWPMTVPKSEPQGVSAGALFGYARVSRDDPAEEK